LSIKSPSADEEEKDQDEEKWIICRWRWKDGQNDQMKNKNDFILNKIS